LVWIGTGKTLDEVDNDTNVREVVCGGPSDLDLAVLDVQEEYTGVALVILGFEELLESLGHATVRDCSASTVRKRKRIAEEIAVYLADLRDGTILSEELLMLEATGDKSSMKEVVNSPTKCCFLPVRPGKCNRQQFLDVAHCHEESNEISGEDDIEVKLGSSGSFIQDDKFATKFSLNSGVPAW
jgi:hypothetical protein